jgi:SAM-dependent methyltransferase
VFTRALAQLVGRGGSVIAVDNDPEALRQLRRLARTLPPDSASVVVADADLRDPGAVDTITDTVLDGALLGNVLHFLADPRPLLEAVLAKLSGRGRIVVIEYDGATANPWVPHPLPIQRLDALCSQVGITRPRIVAGRRSRYHGSIYCALLERSSR